MHTKWLYRKQTIPAQISHPSHSGEVGGRDSWQGTGGSPITSMDGTLRLTPLQRQLSQPCRVVATRAAYYKHRCPSPQVCCLESTSSVSFARPPTPARPIRSQHSTPPLLHVNQFEHQSGGDPSQFPPPGPTRRRDGTGSAPGKHDAGVPGHIIRDE